MFVTDQTHPSLNEEGASLGDQRLAFIDSFYNLSERVAHGTEVKMHTGLASAGSARNLPQGVHGIRPRAKARGSNQRVGYRNCHARALTEVTKNQTSLGLGDVKSQNRSHNGFEASYLLHQFGVVGLDRLCLIVCGTIRLESATGVPHLQDNAPPQDPNLGLFLGSLGGS